MLYWFVKQCVKVGVTHVITPVPKTKMQYLCQDLKT